MKLKILLLSLSLILMTNLQSWSQIIQSKSLSEEVVRSDKGYQYPRFRFIFDVGGNYFHCGKIRYILSEQTYSLNIDLSLSLGCQINKYLYVGIGGGASITLINPYNDFGFLFIDGKIQYPFKNDKFAPYFRLRTGSKLVEGGDPTFYIEPRIGMSFYYPSSSRVGWNFYIGCDPMGPPPIKYGEYRDTPSPSLTFGVGFEF